MFCRDVTVSNLLQIPQHFYTAKSSTTRQLMPTDLTVCCLLRVSILPLSLLETCKAVFKTINQHFCIWELLRLDNMRLNAVIRRQGLQVHCISPSSNPHPATDPFLYQIFANNRNLSSELTPCTKCQLVARNGYSFMVHTAKVKHHSIHLWSFSPPPRCHQIRMEEGELRFNGILWCFLVCPHTSQESPSKPVWKLFLETTCTSTHS